MKLIILPLAIMFIISMLSATGLGMSYLGPMYFGGDPTGVKYYDSSGHPVVYANGTQYGEPGFIMQYGNDAVWVNDTNVFNIVKVYALYWDTNAQYKLLFSDVGKTGSSGIGNINISSSLGFVALIVGLMAFAVIIGLRILGSGVSETGVSAVFKGTAFLALWGVFSFLSMTLITKIPIGNILFLALTLIYVLGIINQIGHPGDE